jgi:hypothetical protein
VSSRGWLYKLYGETSFIHCKELAFAIIPVYFEMSSNYTINDIGAKNVVINIRQMTVMVKMMADSM